MRKPPLVLRIAALTISLLAALAFLGYRVGAFDRLLGKPDKFDGIHMKMMGGSKADPGFLDE